MEKRLTYKEFKLREKLDNQLSLFVDALQEEQHNQLRYQLYNETYDKQLKHQQEWEQELQRLRQRRSQLQQSLNLKEPGDSII